MRRQIAARAAAVRRSIARATGGTRHNSPNLPQADDDLARAGVAASTGGPDDGPSDAPSSDGRNLDEAASGGAYSRSRVVERSLAAETAYLSAALIASALVVSVLVALIAPDLVPPEYVAATPEERDAWNTAALTRTLKLAPVAVLVGLAIRVIRAAGPLAWGSIAFGLLVGTLTRVT